MLYENLMLEGERTYNLKKDWRTMCGMKMMHRKNTNELIDMLGFDESMDKMAKANKMIWYRHILRR